MVNSMVRIQFKAYVLFTVFSLFILEECKWLILLSDFKDLQGSLSFYCKHMH